MAATIRASVSTKIIRRADNFGIYIDVTNSGENEITIKQVKLGTPMGFIKLQDEAYDAHENWEEDVRREKEEERRKEEEKNIVENKNKNKNKNNFNWKLLDHITGDELKADKLEFNYPLEYEHKGETKTVKKITIPKDHYHRFEFAYRAGHWYGYRPKPDTHIVSCTVEYQESSKNDTGKAGESSKNDPQAHTDLEIIVYPSLTGMLFGALLGSFFGTVAHKMITKPIPVDYYALVKDLPLIGTGLLLNLILAFIAAVILMRRKNVDSFITIEDFWGGILVGFVVGYYGFTTFQNLAHFSVSSNATATTYWPLALRI